MNERGFTLLEMLVALTVLALLTVALVQGVRVGVNFWNAQNRRTAEIAGLDAGARVFRAILTTIPIEPASLAAPVSMGFRGRPDWVELIGDLPTGFGMKHRVDMTIALRAGQVVIGWKPYQRNLPDAAPPNVAELVRNVAGLEFAYYGKSSGNAAPSWVTQWDGPALPALIRVRMTFARGDDRRWPELVVAPELWNPGD